MATTLSPVSVGTPLSEQAIRNVNFFNGRLVTHRDMERTLEAQHEADARLGQGLGAGVVQGLDVGVDNALQRQLTIRAGLAVSRAGQTLCLGADQVLALVPSADGAAPQTTGGFGRCGVLSGGSYVAGNGLYLLTLAPLTVDEGKAPVLALEPGNARCNTDALVDAVQFRLLRVDQGLLAERALDANPVGAAAVSKWRSQVAAACFGDPGFENAHRLVGIAPAPDLLAAMRLRGLSDCDVPLALVYLTASQGVAFVDRWSVRRRVAGQNAAPPWSAWVGPQLEALGEARLSQFQDQLLEVPAASLAGLRAADWFGWLPPAGFLEASGARQLDWSAFLGDRKPVRTAPLAPGDVRALLAQALRRDPVALGSVAATPRFRVYRIDGGPWLFVREAPNAPHAEEVWLDGDRARLPGVHDVQSAIDALRGRLCGELSVWPGIDVQARIDALPQGSDLRLCFEAGEYRLERPLRLRRLGHVLVHGGGAGSLLRCEGAETALLIERCDSVSVSDLALRGGRAESGREEELGSGLLGALTVLDVPQVRIDRVQARCSAGSVLGAGGIVVRQTKAAEEDKDGRPRHASITDCEVLVGEAQLGILCVDCELTDIRHNRVLALTPKRPPERGIVVAGSVATGVSIEHNTVVAIAQGIAIGLSRRESEKGEPLQVERAVLSHNTVQVALGERDIKRNRFGLFVGNAQSLLVEGNRVRADGKMALEVGLEAIRLSGSYGKYLAVRSNHMGGAPVGIAFTPQAPLPRSHLECLWLFDANLAENAKEVIQCTGAVSELLREQENQAVP